MATTCDFCGLAMTDTDAANDFWCRRCGATWNGVAGSPQLAGFAPLAECLARWNRENNPTPEQIAEEVAAEAYARRWAAATNDPNGSY